MGARNYLIEGLSGAGKTTVAEELQRRGHHVIHGDRQFAYYGDPETGAPLDWPAFDSESDKVAWGYRHWIWPVERVEALVADRSHPISFFCGGSRNRWQFIALFDKVFVLEADAATLNRRLASRPADVSAASRSSGSSTRGSMQRARTTRATRSASTPPRRLPTSSRRSSRPAPTEPERNVQSAHPLRLRGKAIAHGFAQGTSGLFSPRNGGEAAAPSCPPGPPLLQNLRLSQTAKPKILLSPPPRGR
jgi:hypothetical protein